MRFLKKLELNCKYSLVNAHEMPRATKALVESIDADRAAGIVFWMLQAFSRKSLMNRKLGASWSPRLQALP